MLYQAAMIIKADINETTGIAIQLLQTADLTIETSKTSVPESLYWLFRLIISSEDTDNAFETIECQSSSDERRILMIGQDIVHSGSRGRVKNPKTYGTSNNYTPSYWIKTTYQNIESYGALCFI